LWERDFEPEGFSWIDFSDANNSVISFMRFGKDADRSMLVVVCNLTPVLRQQYRIGVPFEGFYKEVLNTDSSFYRGAGNGNMGGKNAEAVPLHNQKFSINCTLPSLSTVVFKWMGKKKG
jgi:1,4-alpha-glucan branching enzyme